MSRAKVIAVSGGIGSGKSVVCKILMALGYQVYNCDIRAKQIMDEDAGIKERLVSRISPLAVEKNGGINRRVISEIVFNDASKLSELNSIVHGAVRDDIRRWVAQITGKAFIETAILYQSGIDKMVDEVWEVTAPDEIRIERVCKRNGLSALDVARRIESQAFRIQSPHPDVKVILNDNIHSLLLQVNCLIE